MHALDQLNKPEQRAGAIQRIIIDIYMNRIPSLDSIILQQRDIPYLVVRQVDVQPITGYELQILIAQ